MSNRTLNGGEAFQLTKADDALTALTYLSHSAFSLVCFASYHILDRPKLRQAPNSPASTGLHAVGPAAVRLRRMSDREKQRTMTARTWLQSWRAGPSQRDRPRKKTLRFRLLTNSPRKRRMNWRTVANHPLIPSNAEGGVRAQWRQVFLGRPSPAVGRGSRTKEKWPRRGCPASRISCGSNLRFLMPRAGYDQPPHFCPRCFLVFALAAKRLRVVGVGPSSCETCY